MIGIGVGIPHTKGIQRLKYLLNENFAQGATAAYSLGLLREEHNGSAVRIRRDIDNTEKDIGFSEKNFDTQTAENFANGNDLTKAGDYGSGAEAIYSLRYATDNYSGSVVRARRDIDNAEQDFTPAEITDGTLTDFAKGNNLTKAGDYGAGAAAIYSLRYATDNYRGVVIRVREDSGNTEQDFTPTEIIDGTLTSFVGSNNGFVSKWYDQSGNGNDAEQSNASKQPKIVSSGSLVKQNGKVALDFDGLDDYFNAGSNSSIDNIWDNGGTFAGVFEMPDADSGKRILAKDSTRGASGNEWSIVAFDAFTPSKAIMLEYHYSNNRGLWSFKENVEQEGQFVLSFMYNASNTNKPVGRFDESSATIIEDTSPSGTRNDDSGKDLLIGEISDSNLRNMQGKVQELILYSSDESSNLKSIQEEINNYYDIYTSTITNAFVSKWYDQSGNGYDASNSTASEQPQIVNSGSVIKENGQPAISGNGAQQLTGQLDITIATQPFEIFGVVQYADTSNFTVPISNFDSSGNRVLHYAVSNELRIFAGSVLGNGGFTDTTQILHGGLYNGASSKIFLDGTQVTTGDVNNRNYKGVALFNQNPKNRRDAFFKGKLQEVIIYDSDKSSNRDKIEAEIESYYNITSNNDAFVTKWYDQSGNLNDASNGTASEQPQIVSGGSIIQSNNEPALNFNGSSHFLQASGGLDTTKDFSVLVRLEFEKDKLERVINTNDDDNGFRFFPINGNVNAGIENNTKLLRTFYSPKPLNTSLLISITHDGDLRIFENDTEKSKSKNHQFSGGDPVGPSIGAKGFQKTEFFNGKMNTVLFYDKSVDNEISKFNKNI